MKHARLTPDQTTIYTALTPEVRDADWAAENAPPLAGLPVPYEAPEYYPPGYSPPETLDGLVLADPDPDRRFAHTLTLAVLYGKARAVEAAGHEARFDAYARATGRANDPVADETLEAAAAGDAAAQRQIAGATAAGRSLRNLAPYRGFRDTVTDAANILRYAGEAADG